MFPKLQNNFALLKAEIQMNMGIRLSKYIFFDKKGLFSFRAKR
jgi:hypothetical protein